MQTSPIGHLSHQSTQHYSAVTDDVMDCSLHSFHVIKFSSPSQMPQNTSITAVHPKLTLPQIDRRSWFLFCEIPNRHRNHTVDVHLFYFVPWSYSRRIDMWFWDFGSGVSGRPAVVVSGARSGGRLTGWTGSCCLGCCCPGWQLGRCMLPETLLVNR